MKEDLATKLKVCIFRINLQYPKLISLLLIFQILFSHCTVKAVRWDEGKGKRSACIATAATAHQWGKRGMAKAQFHI